MSESEKAIVRAMLIAARFKESDLDWMVASCPSVERAKEVCLEQKRRRA